MMVPHWQPVASAARDRRTIARIVRVNHAGEYGAIRIYRAQIAVADRRWGDVAATLREILSHEEQHRAAFFAAMPSRDARPCRAMWLWGWGGWILGFATAIAGRQAVWICTAAVEAAVHRHLNEQLAFLRDRDGELHGIISAIHEEELSHLRHAEAQLAEPSTVQRLVGQSISGITDVLIWLSTRGDSRRMLRELRSAESWSACVSPEQAAFN
jgi:ubiquinone biosynthesis monooxygenase Coq7